MSGKHGVLRWIMMLLSMVPSAGCIYGQTASVTVDTTSRNYVIPPDFAGLGFETATVTSNANQGGVAGNFWSPGNSKLVTLFQNLSVKNLRIGGSTVNGFHPTNSDIDALFHWAPLAGVHVIYSVPIYCHQSGTQPYYCPQPSDDAAIAGHISTAGYQSLLQSISIGNEQDWHGFLYGRGGTDPNISDLPTYLTDWQKFASAIDQTVSESYAPPDTESYSTSSYYTGSSCGTSYPKGVSWTQGFADCKVTSGGILTSRISSITQHLYVGDCHCWTNAGIEYYLSPSQAIEDMLSGDWVNNDSGSGPHLATGPYGLEPYTPYQWLYNNNLSSVLKDKLTYRLTESNDFLGGVDGASNAFASALWALDYMHWWAAHGAAGVNFHNNQWLYTDTILPGNLPATYGQAPVVRFTGGNCPSVCANTSAFVSSKGTSVTSVTVNNGGAYTTAPTGVTIDPPCPRSGCTSARATVQTAAIPGTNPVLYKVTGVTVTNGGGGYLPAGCQNSSGVQEVCDDWVVTPKGYGIKAFDLGGHGYAETVTLSDSLNPTSQATAYAVGSGLTSYVTFINKTNRVRGNSASVSLTIQPQGFSTASGAYMTLTSGTAGDPTPKAAMLAGQTITNNSPWLGRWTPLPPDTSGSLTLSVPAAEAVVVRIDAAGQLSGPIQMNQDGALEMFAIGPSGRVEHNWQKATDVPQSPSADWSGWTGLSGISSSGGIAVVKNQDNTLQAFVPTSGDVHWSQQRSPGGPWATWTDMTSSAGLDLTNLAAGNNADGSLSVFGLNRNGVIYAISENAPEIGWASSWTPLNTGSGDPTIRPGYVVARNLDGRLELFGADPSGNVWHCWEKTTGGWSSWQKLRGKQLRGKQLNRQLAVARNLGGELQVFGVDASGNVWTDAQVSPGGGWNANWIEITGKALKPGIVIGQNKDGRLALFGVSTQSPNDVWNIWQQGSAGGGFGGNWTDMGGSGLDPELVASSTEDERIQIFAVDSSGAVWSDWQPSTGGDWNGWLNFGGSGLAFYPGQP